MSQIKNTLFNEHEVNEYFCDRLAANWEKINKKLIKNEHVFGSAIDYHTKLIRRGIDNKYNFQSSMYNSIYIDFYRIFELIFD